MKVTKCAGLYTSGNPYELPEGSLAQADNVVIREKDVLEPRRGYDKLGYNFSSSSARADAIAFFGSTPIVNTVDGSTYKLCRDTGSALTDYSGTYTPSDTTTLRMKFAEVQQNFYFNTTTGLKVLSSTTGTPAPAGVYDSPGADPYGGNTLSGLYGNPAATGSWLAKNSCVAYRYVFGIRDANGNLKLSAPSPRLVITNPADVNTTNISRSAGNVVTVTVTSHGFKTLDVVSLDSVDGTFGTGPHTITSVTATTFTYNEGGGAAATANAHTYSSGTKKTDTSAWFDSSYITTSHFYRVYRSVVATAGVDPGDELYLIYEAPVTSTHVSNKRVELIDAIPESLLFSTPLYTNSSTGDSIAAANYMPRLSKDIAFWQDRLWLANTTEAHSFDLRVLGFGSPDGVQNNDLVVIAGIPFHFYDAISGSSNADYVSIPFYSAGATPAINIDRITKDLVYYINYSAMQGTVAVRARYTSAVNDAPGQLRLEATSLSGSTFYVGASRPASWSPVVDTASVVQNTSARVASTVTVNTATNHGFTTGQQVYLASLTPQAAFPVGLKTVTVTGASQFTYTEAGSATTFNTSYVVHGITHPSANDANPHRLFYSKLQQPEAVPLLNYVDVGAKNKAILRILPLRDKLFVFKEDGVYTVAGEYPFRVDELDLTVKLLAPDSAAVMANRIFGVTNQGVAMTTEAGCAIISRPIENDFTPIVSSTATTWRRPTFGVAYETEHQYMLWIPPDATSATCSRAFLYNVLNNTWTKRTDTQKCGRVNPITDYLYLGAPSNETLFKENKSYGVSDCADDSFAVTITAISGNTVTLSSTSGISVGDYITDSDVGTAVVASVDSGTVLTVTAAFVFAATGPGRVYKSFQTTVVYNPIHGEMPGVLKHIREATLHMGAAPDFDLGYLTTTSELSGSTTSTLVTADGSLTLKNIRKSVPKADQRAAVIKPGFSLRQAWSRWKLYGFSLEGAPMSERNSR